MTLNISKRNAQAVQCSMKKMSFYDQFEVGTQVLVQCYKQDLKHKPCWSSKAEIVQVFDNYQYAICWITKGPTNEAHDQPGQICQHHYHHHMLAPINSDINEEQLQNVLDASATPNVYDVHGLLAKRKSHLVIDKDGKSSDWEFLVWWKGFPVLDASWEQRFEY